MSNEVSIFKQGLPAHLQGNTDSANAMVTSGESLPRVSIKGMQFKLKTKDSVVAKAGKGQPMQAVILAVDPPNKNVSRAYFQEGYSGSDEAPTCSSANGVYPDTWIESPCAATCATCPKSAWGSGVNNKGKKIKACSDHKRLILVAPDDVGGAVFVLQVPPTSLKNLSKYGRELAKHKVPVPGVITELSFDQDEEYPKLQFNAVGFLDEQNAGSAMARSESDELQDLLNVAAEPGPVQETAASEAHAALPSPPAEKVRVMLTDDFTYDEYIASGWTDDALISAGHMKME